MTFITSLAQFLRACRRATSLMQRASEWVLGRGRQCRVDAEIVCWPDRYIDGRGANMWSFIQSHLGEEVA